MVLTVLVTPGQELQVIDVVVVIARGAQNFKRQVSYDWRGSAKDDRTIHQRGLTMVATPQRGGYSLHDNDHCGGLVSQEQGQGNNFAVVKHREAGFSKVLSFVGI